MSGKLGKCQESQEKRQESQDKCQESQEKCQESQESVLSGKLFYSLFSNYLF